MKAEKLTQIAIRKLLNPQDLNLAQESNSLSKSQSQNLISMTQRRTFYTSEGSIFAIGKLKSE